MGYSVHQLGIDLMPCATGGFCFSCCRWIARLIYRSVSLHRPFDQLIRFTDSIRYLAFDQLFPVETIHGHLRVSCNDNTVCLPDFLICENIFGASGSPGLYFDKAAGSLCGLLQSFGSHISMSDSGRAGCNSQDPAGSLRILLLCLSGKLIIQIRALLICLIHNLKKFLHCSGIFQISYKLLIHKQHGQLAQYVQMDIVLCIWRSNKKDQMNRLPVKRVKVHAFLNDHSRQSRLQHSIAFSMGNRNSFSDSCCPLLFSAIDLLPVCLLIPDLSTLHHQRHCLVKSFLFR